MHLEPRLRASNKSAKAGIPGEHMLRVAPRVGQGSAYVGLAGYMDHSLVVFAGYVNYASVGFAGCSRNHRLVGLAGCMDHPLLGPGMVACILSEYLSVHPVQVFLQDFCPSVVVRILPVFPRIRGSVDSSYDVLLPQPRLSRPPSALPSAAVLQTLVVVDFLRLTPRIFGSLGLSYDVFLGFGSFGRTSCQSRLLLEIAMYHTAHVDAVGHSNGDDEFGAPLAAADVPSYHRLSGPIGPNSGFCHTLASVCYGFGKPQFQTEN